MLCVLAESDNESVPTSSPVKQNIRVRVKTLEEIRLEKIQAESAAYYSYPIETSLATTESADDLRNRIIQRLNKKTTPSSEFQILSLDEIRKRKLQSDKISKLSGNKAIPNKKIKLSVIKTNTDIRIKTLAEIRAAKQNPEDNINEQLILPEVTESTDKRPKRSHSPITFAVEESLRSAKDTTEILTDKNLHITPIETPEVHRPEVSSSNSQKRSHSPDLEVSSKKTCDSTDSSIVSSTVTESPPKKIKLNRSQENGSIENGRMEENGNHLDESTLSNYLDKSIFIPDNSTATDFPDVVLDCRKSEDISVTDKILRTEESLLLDDDSHDSSVSLTGADDILQNIDDILND